MPQNPTTSHALVPRDSRQRLAGGASSGSGRDRPWASSLGWSARVRGHLHSARRTTGPRGRGVLSSLESLLPLPAINQPGSPTTPAWSVVGTGPRSHHLAQEASCSPTSKLDFRSKFRQQGGIPHIESLRRPLGMPGHRGEAGAGARCTCGTKSQPGRAPRRGGRPPEGEDVHGPAPRPAAGHSCPCLGSGSLAFRAPSARLPRAFRRKPGGKPLGWARRGGAGPLARA